MITIYKTRQGGRNPNHYEVNGEHYFTSLAQALLKETLLLRGTRLNANNIHSIVKDTTERLKTRDIERLSDHDKDIDFNKLFKIAKYWI